MINIKDFPDTCSFLEKEGYQYYDENGCCDHMDELYVKNFARDVYVKIHEKDHFETCYFSVYDNELAMFEILLNFVQGIRIPINEFSK